MHIAILPDEIRVDLSSVDAALWGGITAVVRPLDVEELMRWVDAFPGDDTRRQAAVALVKKQLLKIEGVTIDGDVAFDPANAGHFAALFSADRDGPTAIAAIYTRIMARTGVTGEAEKNSDSPSGSDIPSLMAP